MWAFFAYLKYYFIEATMLVTRKNKSFSDLICPQYLQFLLGQYSTTLRLVGQVIILLIKGSFDLEVDHLDIVRASQGLKLFLAGIGH